MMCGRDSLLTSSSLSQILKGVRDEFFAEVAAGGSNPDVKVGFSLYHRSSIHH